MDKINFCKDCIHNSKCDEKEKLWCEKYEYKKQKPINCLIEMLEHKPMLPPSRYNIKLN